LVLPEVVGIERDAASIERAQARVAAAGLRNVTFLKTDVNNIVIDQLLMPPSAVSS
jgi:tRNA G46 methylase TrmB